MLFSSSIWSVYTNFVLLIKLLFIKLLTYWSNLWFVDPTFGLLTQPLTCWSNFWSTIWFVYLYLTKSEVSLNWIWAWHNFSHSLFHTFSSVIFDFLLLNNAFLCRNFPVTRPGCKKAENYFQVWEGGTGIGTDPRFLG